MAARLKVVVSASPLIMPRSDFRSASWRRVAFRGIRTAPWLDLQSGEVEAAVKLLREKYARWLK